MYTARLKVPPIDSVYFFKSFAAAIAAAFSTGSSTGAASTLVSPGPASSEGSTSAATSFVVAAPPASSWMSSVISPGSCETSEKDAPAEGSSGTAASPPEASEGSWASSFPGSLTEATSFVAPVGASAASAPDESNDTSMAMSMITLIIFLQLRINSPFLSLLDLLNEVIYMVPRAKTALCSSCAIRISVSNLCIDPLARRLL